MLTSTCIHNEKTNQTLASLRALEKPTFSNWRVRRTHSAWTYDTTTQATLCSWHRLSDGTYIRDATDVCDFQSFYFVCAGVTSVFYIYTFGTHSFHHTRLCIDYYNMRLSFVWFSCQVRFQLRHAHVHCEVSQKFSGLSNMSAVPNHTEKWGKVMTYTWNRKYKKHAKCHEIYTLCIVFVDFLTFPFTNWHKNRVYYRLFGVFSVYFMTFYLQFWYQKQSILPIFGVFLWISWNFIYNFDIKNRVYYRFLVYFLWWGCTWRNTFFSALARVVKLKRGALLKERKRTGARNRRAFWVARSLRGRHFVRICNENKTWWRKNKRKIMLTMHTRGLHWMDSLILRTVI